MYAAPDSYYEDLTAQERRITVQLSMGVGIDQTAADDLVGIDGTFLEMTNLSQATDSNYIITHGLATFEGAGIPSAVSAGMVAPPITSVDYPPETGLWSDVISDADGAIEWTLGVRLSKPHTSAFSLHTQDVHITKGRFQFYNGDALVRDVTVESTSTVFQDAEETTYDHIVVTVLGLTAAYSHVRIAEIEFGASITLSNENIGESLSVIMEYDPLDQSTPLSELRFSLLNVEGEYDADNPDTLLDTIPKWTPIVLSFTQIVEGSPQVTIPMGTYYITDREAADNLLSVTAQDARAILQSIVRPVTLSPDKSIGDTYEELLTDVQAPYVIEDDVYDVYPDREVTMDATGWDLLTVSGYIRQYYGVRLDPGRDGYLHASLTTGDEANPIRVETVISYPGMASTQTYNQIDVHYGEDMENTFSLDLRTDVTEVRAAFTVSNPLILDAENAERIARSLVGIVELQQYQADAIADATLEPRDLVPVAGRWSADAPMTYRLTSIEYAFNGALTMTVKGFRV